MFSYKNRTWFTSPVTLKSDKRRSVSGAAHTTFLDASVTRRRLSVRDL
jgi:hypothetical protein